MMYTNLTSSRDCNCGSFARFTSHSKTTSNVLQRSVLKVSLFHTAAVQGHLAESAALPWIASTKSLHGPEQSGIEHEELKNQDISLVQGGCLGRILEFRSNVEIERDGWSLLLGNNRVPGSASKASVLPKAACANEQHYTSDIPFSSHSPQPFPVVLPCCSRGTTYS